MNSIDRTAQLQQLIEEISRLEEELKAVSLRDAHSLDEHRRTIQLLRIEIAKFQQQQKDDD